MQFGICLRFAGLLPSDIIYVYNWNVWWSLGSFGCPQLGAESRLQPLNGTNPDHVAVGETVNQLKDIQHYLYLAVDPTLNRVLRVRLFSKRNTAVS